MDKDFQTKLFKDTEGDAWFARNKDTLGHVQKEHDRLYVEITKLFGDASATDFTDARILEAGCSYGFRLDWLRNQGARVTGFDPSKEAISFGRKKFQMTDSELVISDCASFFKLGKDKYDAIVFAHCLYLINPDDIPSIVAGACSALKEGGFVLIYDFDSDPQRNEYHHAQGVYSYKAKYDTYFTWLPYMHLIKKEVFERGNVLSKGSRTNDHALSIIRKISTEQAFVDSTKEV